jgi:hypothetical protein
MIRSPFLFVLFVFCCVNVCRAQDDFSWWNQIHGWDGVTPWNRYLTVSAKYLGPNALPVPEIRDARIDSFPFIELLAGGHFSLGDRTLDGNLRLGVPVAAGKVSVEVQVVPCEYYVTDTVTRDLRASRERDGKGFAFGDIRFATLIQILRAHDCLPDIELEMAFRTASGKSLLAARYTDAPGYHMDLSFGRDFRPEAGFILRAYGLVGYYGYQTFDPQHLQNDCFLYGIGACISNADWSWSHQFAGYSGYLENGDRPRLYRSELRRKGTVADGLLQVQIGLHDFGYRSVHAGVCWKFWKPAVNQRTTRKLQR